MKPEIKTRWIQALRSGQFQQGRNRLCEDDKYCCLGVLLELNYKNLGIAKKQVKTYVEKRFAYDSNSTYLTRKTRDLLGLTLDQHDRLIALNDVSAWSFNEISHWIELNIPVTS